MLAYVATKDQFLQDAPVIEDLVRDKVQSELGINISRNSSEYLSWRNSLGNAMYHVIHSSRLPSDAGVAIEYRLHGRQQRIDFIISGKNKAGLSQLVLIELKQWTDVTSSPLADHVRTYLGGANRDVNHPSYQSWSYSRLLQDFYEVVTEDPIEVAPCAYLHNCLDGAALRTMESDELLMRAPLFLRNEREGLQQFLSTHIEEGDHASVVRRIEESRIRPSKQLVEMLGSMLEGNEEFVLIDEQKTAYETIRAKVKSVVPGERLALIVKGGPGTGKSVIAVNALVSLLDDGLNVRYVTKNAAPRAVYQTKLKSRRSNASVANLFISSDSFHALEPDTYDVLLVDEAHRLVEKSGFYRNLGENQIKEIIRSARVSVFFTDESQLVTWRDIGTLDEIRSWAGTAESPVEELQLSAQFRCAGSDEYLKWLDSTLRLSSEEAPNMSACEYDIRIFDSPEELRDKIFELNRSNNRSRLLAGYCWQWVSRNDASKFDINFEGTDFAMKWNLTSDGSNWMIAPNSIHEIGCIHTCQGLEGDYMGVIVGPDLAIEGGLLVGKADGRAKHDKSLQGLKAALGVNPVEANKKADRLIRNTYRTMMTRGMVGTFIYCDNPEVATFLRRSLEQSGYVQRSI
ncbi:MAG: DUF2075 domain-containing protein [Gallionella sp.]|jgi:hypothetical protein|nr:DUF2075 domain-containing protein [Gallionella sp.]